ncbi:MAG: HepT-like ribonuclease domain-containing protein, partial [Nanoarchaeota archaeon]
FNKNIIELIRQMKGFRNILVHKYGDIDDSKAYEDIKDGLPDFETVIKDIEKFIETHKKKNI